MYLHKTPDFLQKLYPDLTWNRSNGAKNIYLTFDDGPIPDITEFVIDTLDEFGAKGTFFCVGDNVKKHPEVFQKVLESGNQIGNHTYNHLNGWKVDSTEYFRNTLKCERVLEEKSDSKVRLFRPPYGKLPRKLISRLTKKYDVIMWDNLSADFDADLPKEKCLSEVIKNTSNGSIVVFHDSIKAFRNLKYVLPRYLEHFSSLGFAFKAL